MRFTSEQQSSSEYQPDMFLKYKIHYTGYRNLASIRISPIYPTIQIQSTSEDQHQTDVYYPGEIRDRWKVSSSFNSTTIHWVFWMINFLYKKTSPRRIFAANLAHTHQVTPNIPQWYHDKEICYQHIFNKPKREDRTIGVSRYIKGFQQSTGVSTIYRN